MNLPRDRQASISAVVGIVAFVDVPLVFFSARLWRSIHPAVFASQGGGLESEMKITVIVCVLLFGLVFGALTALRYTQARQTDRLDALATRETL